MKLAELLQPDRIAADIRVADKAELLSEIARRAAAATGLDSAAIRRLLTARENLGSTGIGAGVAVPHAQIPGLEVPYAMFVRLRRPVDFAAVDMMPVDLVFTLLTPVGTAAGTHLAALAAMCRRLRLPEVVDQLRQSQDPQKLYELLVAES